MIGMKPNNFKLEQEVVRWRFRPSTFVRLPAPISLLYVYVQIADVLRPQPNISMNY